MVRGGWAWPPGGDRGYLRASVLVLVHAPRSPDTSCWEPSPCMWLREYPTKNGSRAVTSSFRQEVSSASQEHRHRNVAKMKGSL